jgi:hypothetical protein
MSLFLLFAFLPWMAEPDLIDYMHIRNLCPDKRQKRVIEGFLRCRGLVAWVA